MIRGREANGVPPTDLLVCFPKRAHLTLMPSKATTSQARPSEPSKRQHNGRHVRNKSMPRVGIGRGGQFNSWEKNSQRGVEGSEPTSPKVTCSGQVKVRDHGGATCKSWQSVIHEFEKIHIKEKRRKRTALEYLGLKKDVLNFLTCLRNIRFDFRCFGAFPRHEISSDDEQDEDQEEEDDDDHVFNKDSDSEGSRTEFSKWYMVLPKNQNSLIHKEAKSAVPDKVAPAAPPPNALFLMRCSSAPSSSWLRMQQENEEDGHSKVDNILHKKKLKTLMEEEEKIDKERLMAMRYDTGHYRISSDIAKETWVSGSVGFPLSRSRSWKG